MILISIRIERNTKGSPSAFEMQECPVKCEECFRYNADIK